MISLSAWQRGALVARLLPTCLAIATPGGALLRQHRQQSVPARYVVPGQWDPALATLPHRASHPTSDPPHR
ncbi:MAG: hypothetical protein H0X24_03755 [Ktedonobacterales bacterium]|nr:hypothetical protein [Ktedonobacterales bacterium]